jgi:nucleoside 2-deoxyribosyltransferase
MANATQPRPRIYLAGPEVFLPDAREVGRRKSAMCDAAGLEGVFPLDAELDLSGMDKHEQARAIALGNEGLMRSCDAIIANLTPFRGVSMDSGTAFEVGFMRALGKPSFAYTNAGATDYASRARDYRRLTRLPTDCDCPEFEIEDFGLVENLMIAVAVRETPSAIAHFLPPPHEAMASLKAFELCLAQARRHFMGV